MSYFLRLDILRAQILKFRLNLQMLSIMRKCGQSQRCRESWNRRWSWGFVAGDTSVQNVCAFCNLRTRSLVPTQWAPTCEGSLVVGKTPAQKSFHRWRLACDLMPPSKKPMAESGSLRWSWVCSQTLIHCLMSL